MSPALRCIKLAIACRIIPRQAHPLSCDQGWYVKWAPSCDEDAVIPYTAVQALSGNLCRTTEIELSYALQSFKGSQTVVRIESSVLEDWPVDITVQVRPTSHTGAFALSLLVARQSFP